MDSWVNERRKNWRKGKRMCIYGVSGCVCSDCIFAHQTISVRLSYEIAKNVRTLISLNTTKSIKLSRIKWYFFLLRFVSFSLFYFILCFSVVGGVDCRIYSNVRAPRRIHSYCMSARGNVVHMCTISIMASLQHVYMCFGRYFHFVSFYRLSFISNCATKKLVL